MRWPHAESRNWIQDSSWKTGVTSWEHAGEGGPGAPGTPGFIARAGSRPERSFLPRGRVGPFALLSLSVEYSRHLKSPFPARNTASRWAGVAIVLASSPCMGLVICSQSFCNNSWCQPLQRSKSKKRISTVHNYSIPLPPSFTDHITFQMESHFNKFGPLLLFWVQDALKYRSCVSEPASIHACWQHGGGLHSTWSPTALRLPGRQRDKRFGEMGSPHSRRSKGRLCILGPGSLLMSDNVSKISPVALN